uniref:Uncharacterized protein n=1 Tax=Musa acuminata subsp. malaccensis TaxID=214687 RepID=A0A804KKY1_MUSAM
MLLDETEKEFGYTIAGLLKLPCGVKLFQRVLCKVEQDATELHLPRCNFAKGHDYSIVAVQTGPSTHLVRMAAPGSATVIRNQRNEIKELVASGSSSDSRMFGEPSKLESVKLHDLHPASWYCVAWYPIYRIPDGSFHAAFLTYHSLGHFVHRSSPESGHGLSEDVVSPVAGLQTYNHKGESWFQLWDMNSKVVQSEDVNHSDTSELIKERLRTLRQTASVLARAVVSKGNQRYVNRHPDYNFFVSRSG